jgi:hypothetical protein
VPSPLRTHPLRIFRVEIHCRVPRQHPPAIATWLAAPAAAGSSSTQRVRRQARAARAQYM